MPELHVVDKWVDGTAYRFTKLQQVRGPASGRHPGARPLNRLCGTTSRVAEPILLCLVLSFRPKGVEAK